MTNRTRPFEFFQLFLSENLRDQSHALVLEEGLAGAVAGHNPRAFLPAMLQSKQAIIGQHRRIRMTEHAEESALVLRERDTIGQLFLGGIFRGHDKGTSSKSSSGSIFQKTPVILNRADDEGSRQCSQIDKQARGSSPCARLGMTVGKHHKLGIGSESLSTARRIAFHQRSCNSATGQLRFSPFAVMRRSSAITPPICACGIFFDLNSDKTSSVFFGSQEITMRDCVSLKSTMATFVEAGSPRDESVRLANVSRARLPPQFSKR